MNYTDALIEILVSFCGTLGFGFLFNIRGRKLWYAAIGGLGTWALFLVLGLLMESEVLRYFIVSLCSTAYAEILARHLKTPATTFCIITLIPLVPGGALYYTTTAALSGDTAQFMPRLINTIQLAVALSLGIVIVTAACKLFVKKNTR